MATHPRLVEGDKAVFPPALLPQEIVAGSRLELRANPAVCGHSAGAAPVPVAQTAVMPGGGKKKKATPEFADYVDLRLSHPPRDPAELVKVFDQLCSKPRSPPGWPVVKFAPPGHPSVQLRRWLYWQTLSEVGIRVHEYYAFTQFAHLSNAAAAGNDGAEGVQWYEQGTVNWFTEDKRIDSPNGSREMWKRVMVAFPPWKPEEDLGSYTARRIPKQITNAFGPLAGRVQNPFF